jgi:hypothetical protein
MAIAKAAEQCNVLGMIVAFTLGLALASVIVPPEIGFASLCLLL